MATSSSSPGTALPPPPGEAPNVTNPNTMAMVTIVAVSVCFSTTTVPFMLRTYVRMRIKHSFKLEDWGCLLSWIGLVIYLALTLVALANHAGTHEWDLLKEQVPNALYWLNANSATYGIAILCTKISILLLYQRVFFPQPWSRSGILLKAFMALLAGFYISTTLAKVWQCLPREHIWDKNVPGACINISVLFNISGIFNAVTDVIILLIPVKVVWSLNMKRKHKLGVLAVFTVGSIAPIFSIVGLVVRFRVSGSPDLTYNQLQISLWAGAEVSTGLICVCLPELPALWTRRRNGSSMYGQSSSSARDGGPSIGGGLTSATRGYTTRANGEVMGKRDLEYGQLLDDDSDGAGGTVMELQSRQSASAEGGSEKDIGMAVGGYPVPTAPERAATVGRGRYGDNAIMKTVSMEVSSSNRENKGKHYGALE